MLSRRSGYYGCSDSGDEEKDISVKDDVLLDGVLPLCDHYVPIGLVAGKYIYLGRK